MLRRSCHWLLWLLLASLGVTPSSSRGGGVTIITHGLNGNVNGWVTGMANAIPAYRTFPGTNYTGYEFYFFLSNSVYYLTSTRVAGGAPSTTDTGEIIVKFDWSQFADGNSYNTAQVAAIVLPALINTNFIPELGGHALAEMPLHLVGHSRGGSLMCELSRLLGTNGIWVDHLTTLDPHPLNNDGFTLDHFIYSAVDAPCHTYQNVLFHDNYSQNISHLVYGEPVAGAYIRNLTSLNGGYTDATTGKHSNVHLWYFGTISPATPTSDTEASITSAERQSWWNTYEQQGTNAGFQYSLIGGSNRLSTDQPFGPGFPAIRDGFNQMWDLGAGTSANRTALTTNNGAWPSLIRLDRTDTNPVVQGQSAMVNFYYQWTQPAASNATISFYLDSDLNPLNTNQTLLSQIGAPGSGANSVGFGSVALTLNSSNASPGLHWLYATITGGGPTRWLYAPERVLVVSPPQPVMGIARAGASQFNVAVNGTNGETVVLQSSPDLIHWQAIATNALTTNAWIYTNTNPGGTNKLFFRTVISN